MSIQSNVITRRDKKLLDLCSSKETRGSYTHYFLNNEKTTLTTMLLQEVLRYQDYLNQYGNDSRKVKITGVGRYLQMKPALEAGISYLGLNVQNIRFTEQIQDMLIIARLEQQRQYLEWKAGVISDTQFQYNLAQEFYTVPMPGALTERNSAPIFGGQASHDSGTFLQEITDIRKLG